MVALVAGCGDTGAGDFADSLVGADVGSADTTVEDDTPAVADGAEAAGDDTLSGHDLGPTADADDTGGSWPDPAFVHVVRRDEPLVSAAATYLADEATLYRTADQVPDPDVRAIAVWDGAPGEVWVGTPSGLLRHDLAGQVFVAAPGAGEGAGAVVDIAARPDAEGRLVVLWENALQRLEPTSGEHVTVQLPDGDWSTLAVDPSGAAWLGGPSGVATDETGEWTAVSGPEDAFEGPVRDLAIDVAGVRWILTAKGLWRDDGVYPELRWSGDGRAVAWDGQGFAWVATDAGVARIDGLLTGARDWKPSVQWVAEPLGLATGDGLAVAATGGRVVVGHAIGATALELDPAGQPGRTDYYTRSTRWFPGAEARVTSVAVSGDGTVYWFGTAAGLTRIDWVERTLADVAEHHEQQLQDHFWRLEGFVGSDAWIDDPWQPTTWAVSDFDNDGLWTQMQVGAWCYAYAVTGEERFYDSARKAMDQMFLLVDLPATDFEAAGLGRGFVARSFVRDDEGGVYEDKLTQSNWHPVQWEGHEYRWKDDTSSDELAGHFFGFPLFYDLCAKTDAERAAVAERAGAIARYVVEGGYVLRDLDGEPTTHGHWEPERLAVAVDGFDECEAPLEVCGEAYFGGGWLNSLEIMGHLLAAYHMTGDVYFYEAYDVLVTEHRYDIVAMPHEQTVTVTTPQFMNHSDHELAMLAYTTLIRYEPDDERRQLWIESLLFMHEWELVERNPLWSGFVQVAAGEGDDELQAALRSLREMPSDRRGHLVDNSHRADGTPWPNDRFDEPQFQEVFPYDEIRTVWWNGNLHVAQHGGSLNRVSGPMAWLLPYWLLRYGGVIGE